MAITASNKLYQDALGVQGREPYRLLNIEFNTKNDQGFEDPVAVFMCDQTDIMWNGVTWFRSPFEIRGEGYSADQENARPNLILPNEERRFSYFAESGDLDGARVTLYEVHPDEINTQQAIVRHYILARVSSDNRMQISFELRTPSDGPNFKLPARRFMPPEFTTVKF